MELPLIRHVLRMGAWVVLAMVTQFLVNYVDTAMVGRLEGKLGSASQSALGVAMPAFWLIGGSLAAINVGTQAITGRRFAAGQDTEAGQVLTDSLCIAVVAGVVGGALGYFVTPGVINYFATATDDQRQLGIEYTQIRMIGVAGMVITFSYKGFFDGIGRTYVHLWAALAMNLFNIVLNYLLIFGNETLGIPRLELAGAGIASVISTYLGLLIMIGASLFPKTLSRFRFYRFHRIKSRLLTRIAGLMIPSGLASAILMIGFLLFVRFVGLIDAAEGNDSNTYSAATKAIMDTAALCFMPLIALGTATATCVSQSLGAGKPNLAARYGWESARVAVFAIFVLGAVFFAVPTQIIAVLAPNDPAVPEAAATSLRIVTLSLPLMAVGLVLAQALYGAGANLFVFLVELALQFGFLVPAAYVLGPLMGYGMEGVWLAAAIYASLLGVIMGAKFLGDDWRRIKL